MNSLSYYIEHKYYDILEIIESYKELSYYKIFNRIYFTEEYIIVYNNKILYNRITDNGDLYIEFIAMQKLLENI